MSTINFRWHSAAPPKPDVYTTRRNNSTYLTLRYWDGQRWFGIDYGPKRGGAPMKWPKPSITKRPSWAVRNEGALYLKNIKVGQDCIQWGEPFRVYDQKEVLTYLVQTGVLPADWREAYQDAMRGRAAQQKGGAA